MKWTFFLVLIAIGHVAGKGAWKENHEYKYKYVDMTTESDSDSNEEGFIISVGLTIRPQSDSVLIGRITDAAAYIIVAGDTDERGAVPKDLAIEKEFKIYLKNGVIESLSADRTMTSKEVNNLKRIVSQLQVDTEAKNVLLSMKNRLPTVNSNSAFYTTMETTQAGTCETTYDISQSPSLTIYSTRKDIIEIKKQVNTKNCKELSEANLMGIDTRLDVSLETRIIISGSLDSFVIRSSRSTNNLLNLNNFSNMSLESVKFINDNSNQTESDNMVNVGNLIYQ